MMVGVTSKEGVGDGRTCDLGGGGREEFECAVRGGCSSCPEHLGQVADGLGLDRGDNGKNDEV
jgi:hypothetical protein